jgi:ABC-type arginine transport system permease subunit
MFYFNRKESEMKKALMRAKELLTEESGMEMVQVAILVAIAIVIGLIFRTQIAEFVNDVFSGLSSGKFS